MPPSAPPPIYARTQSNKLSLRRLPHPAPVSHSGEGAALRLQLLPGPSSSSLRKWHITAAARPPVISSLESPASSPGTSCPGSGLGASWGLRGDWRQPADEPDHWTQEQGGPGFPSKGRSHRPRHLCGGSAGLGVGDSKRDILFVGSRTGDPNSLAGWDPCGPSDPRQPPSIWGRALKALEIQYPCSWHQE